MATVKAGVKIENIDPEVCRMMGGKITKDNKCMVRIIIEENRPREIKVEQLDDEDL